MPDSNSSARVTLREAAMRLGVSEGAIRKRVARGTIRSEMGDDGLRYAWVDAGTDVGEDSGTDGGADALIAELRDRVRFVEGQLEAERQAHAEARRIIGGLVQRIPELEAPAAASAPSDAPGAPTVATEQPGRVEPQAPLESPQEGAERRSWWREFFGFGE